MQQNLFSRELHAQLNKAYKDRGEGDCQAYIEVGQARIPAPALLCRRYDHIFLHKNDH